MFQKKKAAGNWFLMNDFGKRMRKFLETNEIVIDFCSLNNAMLIWLKMELIQANKISREAQESLFLGSRFETLN